MSDDLRTRIAAAIADYLNLGPDGLAFVDATALADAVIRELQLTVLGDGIVVGVIHA